MTTLTLRAFARKLGFERVSNPDFQALLKRWQIEGVVNVYQGGYKGHSMAHPKKVQLIKPFEFYEYAKEPKGIVELSQGVANELASKLGLKLKTAKTIHECSASHHRIQEGEAYASGSVFIPVKLCSHCLTQIYEGASFTIEPIIKVERRHQNG